MKKYKNLLLYFLIILIIFLWVYFIKYKENYIIDIILNYNEMKLFEKECYYKWGNEIIVYKSIRDNESLWKTPNKQQMEYNIYLRCD
jgi:hypothetical protein